MNIHEPLISDSEKVGEKIESSPPTGFSYHITGEF